MPLIVTSPVNVSPDLFALPVVRALTSEVSDATSVLLLTSPKKIFP